MNMDARVVSSTARGKVLFITDVRLAANGTVPGSHCGGKTRDGRAVRDSDIGTGCCNAQAFLFTARCALWQDSTFESESQPTKKTTSRSKSWV